MAVEYKWTNFCPNYFKGRRTATYYNNALVSRRILQRRGFGTKRWSTTSIGQSYRSHLLSRNGLGLWLQLTDNTRYIKPLPLLSGFATVVEHFLGETSYCDGHHEHSSHVPVKCSTVLTLRVRLRVVKLYILCINMYIQIFF